MDAPQVTFTTELLGAGGNKTGIEVPDHVLEVLGGGRRIPVLVTVGGHTWASTTAVMGGRTLLGVSTENRALAGVEAGQQIEVTLVREQGERQVAVPTTWPLRSTAPGSGRRSTRSPPATARTTSSRSGAPGPTRPGSAASPRCWTPCAAEPGPPPVGART